MDTVALDALEAVAWREWQSAWGNTTSGAHHSGFMAGYKAAGECPTREDGHICANPFHRPSGFQRRIVTLVGRRRDWRLLREAERAETTAGNVVLTVGCIGVNADRGEQDDHDEEGARRCIALHFDKIRMADEIVHATADGTAGEHTQADLGLARSLGKPIRLYPPR